MQLVVRLLIGFVIFVALIFLMGALGGVGVIEMALFLAVAVIAADIGPKLSSALRRA